MSKNSSLSGQIDYIIDNLPKELLKAIKEHSSSESVQIDSIIDNLPKELL